MALTIEEPPGYRSLRRLADGISVVTSKAAVPLFIVMDTDVAKSLGGILKEELRLEQDVVVVDGIEVGDLDYLDIRLPMGVSEVVPVTVKSLVFPDQAGQTDWTSGDDWISTQRPRPPGLRSHIDKQRRRGIISNRSFPTGKILA